MVETTLLFLGSIIGAGFATGAEIITFFGHFQIPIWLIALIVGLNMFLIITLEIFLFYPKTTTQAQQDNMKTAKLLDVVFVMIYLILFTAMTAGITQITNYPTCIISLIFSTLIALFGLHRLSHLNLFLVLIIIVLITTTALPHLFTPLSKQPFQWNQVSTIEYWAILYAGLNCFMFPEFITALARKHKRHKIIKAGAFTAILVTILVGLILSTITVTNTKQAPIPLLAAAPTSVTTIIILLAIITSQYTALFAILQRLQKLIPKTKNKPQLTAACICFIAFLGTFCGFSRIIKFGYPLIGAFTCFYLLIFSLKKFLQFLQHRQH